MQIVSSGDNGDILHKNAKSCLPEKMSSAEHFTQSAKGLSANHICK